jgi:Helicase associated domain
MQSATRTTAATAATATATTAASRPPVSPLITALRNAFKHLSDHQFEEECLIERQRRASLKKKKPPALNNSDTINSRKRPAAVVPHGASTLDDDDDDDSNNNDANTANRSSSSGKKKRKKTTNALSRVTLPLAQPNNADDVPQMAAQAAAADATAKKPHGNCRNWEDRYIELVNYKKEHSTFLNIHQKRPDGRGHGLALWVEMQRYGYENRHHMLETGEIKHNGKTIMTQEQENRLTSIGFDFLFPRQRAFETRFTQISA